MIRVHDIIVIIHTPFTSKKNWQFKLLFLWLQKSQNHILIFVYKFKVAEYAVGDQAGDTTTRNNTKYLALSIILFIHWWIDGKTWIRLSCKQNN